MLAAGIGNIHGKYPEGWPGLRFDVLDDIKAKVGDMPLVLHGGSGIPDAMVYDPRKLLAPGAQGIVDMVKYKIEVFGCAGKA